MGSVRRALCVAFAVWCASSSSLLAHAQEAAPSASADDAIARARAHYERGVALFDEEQFTAALAEFEAAYAISHRPALLFNIGQIQARLGHAVESADALEAYLEQVAEVPAERRALVEAEIATQRGRIVSVTVTADVDGAMVSLDDVDRGTTPLPAPLRVSAGEHLLRVSADGHETSQQRFRVAGGEERALSIDLVRLAGARAGGGAAPFPTITVIGAAVGGLGLVTFGIAGIATLLEHQSLTAMTGGCSPSCTAQEVATIDVTRVVADAGLAVLVVGGVLTVVGAVLELGGSSETAGPRVSLGSGGVEVWW